MMNESVNESNSKPVVAENRVPLGKIKVRSDDETSALVTIGDNLKEQFGSIFVERDEANFVNDNEVNFPERGEKIVEAAFMVFFEQNVSEVGSGEEANLFA